MITAYHEVGNQIYALPNPLDTLEEFRRFTHADIPLMSETDRQRELARIQLRLALDERPHPWFFERQDALQGGVHA